MEKKKLIAAMFLFAIVFTSFAFIPHAGATTAYPTDQNDGNSISPIIDPFSDYVFNETNLPDYDMPFTRTYSDGGSYVYDMPYYIEIPSSYHGFYIYAFQLAEMDVDNITFTFSVVGDNDSNPQGGTFLAANSTATVDLGTGTTPKWVRFEFDSPILLSGYTYYWIYFYSTAYGKHFDWHDTQNNYNDYWDYPSSFSPADYDIAVKIECFKGYAEDFSDVGLTAILRLLSLSMTATI